MQKNGKYDSDFSHVYSDHKIKLQGWRCSNKQCKWSQTLSIKNRLSGNMHTDIIKLQSEFGARHSYRQAASDLKALTGNRKSINKSRIHKVTNKVGKVLADKVTDEKHDEDVSASTIEPAKELYGAVDGGHVHDANNKGHNFEVMIGKIYRPENVVRTDEYHTKIVEKHCAGSAKKDSQETMKQNIIEAAKKEGADKNKTEITILADGAKNCWNIAESLRNYCCVLLCILDWFHIGKYTQTLKKQIPSEYECIIDEAKARLWLGQSGAALAILGRLQATLTSEEHIKKVMNFEKYITDNKSRIINYDEREKAGLIYTSHVAESSVEHLLNERSKRKQKMQWSRNGLHSVMQIRTSQASNEWENDWDNIILPTLQSAA